MASHKKGGRVPKRYKNYSNPNKDSFKTCTADQKDNTEKLFFGKFNKQSKSIQEATKVQKRIRYLFFL